MAVASELQQHQQTRTESKAYVLTNDSWRWSVTETELWCCWPAGCHRYCLLMSLVLIGSTRQCLFVGFANCLLHNSFLVMSVLRRSFRFINTAGYRSRLTDMPVMTVMTIVIMILPTLMTVGDFIKVDSPLGLDRTLGLVLIYIKFWSDNKRLPYLVDYSKLQIIYKIICKFGVRPKIIWTVRSDPQLRNAKNAGLYFWSLRDNPFWLAETTLSLGLSVMLCK